jgi:hypothetical protein
MLRADDSLPLLGEAEGVIPTPPSKTEGSGAVCPRPPDGRGQIEREAAGRGVRARDTKPGTTPPASLKGFTSSSGPPPSWRQGRYLFPRTCCCSSSSGRASDSSSWNYALPGNRKDDKKTTKTLWSGKGRPDMACTLPHPTPSRSGPHRCRKDE